jgi:hypothetical protein
MIDSCAMYVKCSAFAVWCLFLLNQTLPADDLIVRAFAVPPDYFGACDDLPTNVEPLPSIAKVSPFPEGSAWILDRVRGCLVIRTSAEAMQRISKEMERVASLRTDSEPLIYWDEVTFALKRRVRVGELWEATYLMPPDFETGDMSAELVAQGILISSPGHHTHYDPKTRAAKLRCSAPTMSMAVSWITSLWQRHGKAAPFQSLAPYPRLLEVGAVDGELRRLLLDG